MRGKQAGGLLTQQKVLCAVVALFLEKGYVKTTTGEIAKPRASCGKPSKRPRWVLRRSSRRDKRIACDRGERDE